MAQRLYYILVDKAPAFKQLITGEENMTDFHQRFDEVASRIRGLASGEREEMTKLSNLLRDTSQILVSMQRNDLIDLEDELPFVKSLANLNSAESAERPKKEIAHHDKAPSGIDLDDLLKKTEASLDRFLREPAVVKAFGHETVA